VDQTVFQYMREIAHTAIDAGAAFLAAGRKLSREADLLRSRQLLLSYRARGIKHGDWVGMLAKLTFDGTAVKKAVFQFVRHNDDNETVLCLLKNEAEAFGQVSAGTAKLGSKLMPEGDEVAIELLT
jgi:hypothetical protein